MLAEILNPGLPLLRAGGRLAGQIVRTCVRWTGVSLPVSLTSYSVVRACLSFLTVGSCLASH